MGQLRVINIFRRQKKAVLYLHKVQRIWTLGLYFLTHITNESAALSNVVYRCLALWLLSRTQAIPISLVISTPECALFSRFEKFVIKADRRIIACHNTDEEFS